MTQILSRFFENLNSKIYILILCLILSNSIKMGGFKLNTILKKILTFCILLFISGCTTIIIQKAEISEVVFQENFLTNNDNLHILIKVNNGFDVSFTPKIKLEYNAQCFYNYNNIQTFDPIKAKEISKISWTLNLESYRRNCNSYENITFTLYDAATDNLLDKKTKGIDIVQ